MPETELERLERLIKYSKHTNKYEKAIFDKKRLGEESPDFANDPRVAYTDKRFLLGVGFVEALTKKQAVELCESIPDHPVAKTILKAVRRFNDDQRINLNRQTVDTLIEATGKTRSSLFLFDANGSLEAPGKIVDNPGPPSEPHPAPDVHRPEGKPTHTTNTGGEGTPYVNPDSD